MALGNRIKLRRSELQIPQQEVADRAGISQGIIANLERRDSKSTPHASKIAEALDVRLEWLLTGREPKETPFPPWGEGMTKEDFEFLGDPVPDHLKKPSEHTEGETQNAPTIPEQSVIAIDDGSDHSDTHCRVQRFDVTLSAGAGTAHWVMREKDDDPIWFRKGWFKAKRLNPDVLKAMYIRGDSMEDYLYHYDTVFIDITDTEINDGDVYAIVFKDKFYVKELQNWDGEVKIISRNDKYPPMYTDSKEAGQYTNYFQVLGRVAWRGG